VRTDKRSNVTALQSRWNSQHASNRSIRTLSQAVRNRASSSCCSFISAKETDFNAPSIGTGLTGNVLEGKSALSVPVFGQDSHLLF